MMVRSTQSVLALCLMVGFGCGDDDDATAGMPDAGSTLDARAIDAAAPDAGATIDAIPRPDATPGFGRFSLAWTITESGAPSACELAGADAVSIRSTQTFGAMLTLEDIFACGPGAGTTGFLPLGGYRVVVSLLDGATVIAEAPPRVSSIDTDGATVELGVFELDW